MPALELDQVSILVACADRRVSEMPFLSTRALRGLQQYQYKSGGYTIVDQWHQPFWNGGAACLYTAVSVMALGSEGKLC